MASSNVEVCDDDIQMKDFASSKLNSAGREYKDDAFHVCDLGDIVKKWLKFRELLPQVQPFYAMKSNPDMYVLKMLDSLGANFDCASKTEIETILGMGISPERVIFANPCKQTSYIKYAESNGVKLMTFDNELELHKIQHHHPNAELIIRMKVDDSKSLTKLGLKYGVEPSEASRLLKVAWNMSLNVVGVSFHVGSECYDASVFYTAVKTAKLVFDQGNEIGYNFKILDVGGGFPGTDVEEISLEDIVIKLSAGFAEYFPPECNVKIIAEPGRYFVASAFTTICNITSVRTISSDKCRSIPEGFMYYLNDGVYGSFNSFTYYHKSAIPYPLKEGNEPTFYICSIWGPTCDSYDCISTSAMLPRMGIGEWLYFDNTGAYTTACASQFNGFKIPITYYMCHKSLMDYATCVDPFLSNQLAIVSKPAF